jgi:hypothetical protein
MGRIQRGVCDVNKCTNKINTPSLSMILLSVFSSTFSFHLNQTAIIFKMAPSSSEISTNWSTASVEQPLEAYAGPPRNITPIDSIHFASHLQPPAYSILGTPPSSQILFLDVQILDSTGQAPYPGDVLITGERISRVGALSSAEKSELQENPHVRVIQGRGRTLMSGLGDAHTHLSWNGGDLNALGSLHVEEHTLLTARSAKCYLDSGYTM